MARKSFVLLVVGTVIFILCSISSAGVPAMINYQGKLLTSGGALVNDTVLVTFSIYADTGGGSAQWTETQAQVMIKDGIFNVFLGSVDSIPISVFEGGTKYLGVKVGSDPEMRPLKPMVSVPYAYRAGTADGGEGGGWLDDGTLVRLADSADYVGIGTSDPQYKLDVNGDAHVSGLLKVGDSSITVEGNGTNNRILSPTWLRVIIDQNDVSTTQYFSVSHNELPGSPGGGPELFRVQEDGKVGIGTSNPAELLHVRTGAAAGDVIQIGEYTAIGEEYGSGATVIGDNAKPDDPTTVGMEIMATHGAYGARAIRMSKLDGIAFHGQGGSVNAGDPFSSELMRITNDGKVGIGTTTPAEKLDVVGNIHASGSIVSGNSIGVVPANTPPGFPDRLAANGPVIYLYYEDPVNSGIGASTIGIARCGNTLNGSQTKTHINLGVNSITGFAVGNNVYCTVGGGNENKAYADRTTVGGGWGNMANGNSSTVGGGLWNTADGDTAIVGGGSYNHASGASATIGGGHRNEAGKTLATVGGGLSNAASGNSSTVGGGRYNTANGDTAIVGGGSYNHASGASATIGGGHRNEASNTFATVGGGLSNTASGVEATVGGGDWNTANGNESTVGGGAGNTVSGAGATVGGGWLCTASGLNATVGGGWINNATGVQATVGGGDWNTASGTESTVGGGAHNTASGVDAVVAGGYGNTAAGDNSLAAGRQVNVDASADYTFAFGYNFTTATPHAVIFQDTDTPIKVGIGTTSPAYMLDVNGDINVAGSYNVKKGGANYAFPDYVFEPDYKLMPLEEMKKYVSEHKCLPHVVSADEVKKNEGFKMDELLIQMLEKIEEQTLYIFQLEERITEMEKKGQQK